MANVVSTTIVALLLSISMMGCKPTRQSGSKIAAVASIPASTPASLQLTPGVQTWCPNFYSQNNEATTYPPVLTNGACWYRQNEPNSCETLCAKFYGVDTTAMNAMTDNADHLCACITYGFPDYNGLGITYHDSTGITGVVGKPMSVTPMFLTGVTNPTIYNANSKPDDCSADASTPLPKGLSIDPKTCVISGTPVEALAAPTTYFIYASNSNYSRTSSLGRSRPAPVVLTITNE